MRARETGGGKTLNSWFPFNAQYYAYRFYGVRRLDRFTPRCTNPRPYRVCWQRTHDQGASRGMARNILRSFCTHGDRGLIGNARDWWDNAVGINATGDAPKWRPCWRSAPTHACGLAMSRSLHASSIRARWKWTRPTGDRAGGSAAEWL